jgi:hypothetical protein
MEVALNDGYAWFLESPRGNDCEGIQKIYNYIGVSLDDRVSKGFAIGMNKSFIQHTHDRADMIEVPHFRRVWCKLNRYRRNELSQKIIEITIRLLVPF